MFTHLLPRCWPIGVVEELVYQASDFIYQYFLPVFIVVVFDLFLGAKLFKLHRNQSALLSIVIVNFSADAVGDYNNTL